MPVGEWESTHWCSQYPGWVGAGTSWSPSGQEDGKGPHCIASSHPHDHQGPRKMLLDWCQPDQPRCVAPELRVVPPVPMPAPAGQRLAPEPLPTALPARLMVGHGPGAHRDVPQPLPTTTNAHHRPPPPPATTAAGHQQLNINSAAPPRSVARGPAWAESGHCPPQPPTLAPTEPSPCPVPAEGHILHPPSAGPQHRTPVLALQNFWLCFLSSTDIPGLRTGGARVPKHGQGCSEPSPITPPPHSAAMSPPQTFPSVSKWGGLQAPSPLSVPPRGV